MKTNKQFKIWKRFMRFFGKLYGCHQLPERSFHVCGYQFPLCARCTGIFIGEFIVGPILCVFLPISMYVSIGLVLLLAIDGFTQLFGWRQSNNVLRLLTGIGYGYALVSFIFHIVRKIIILI